MNSQPVKNVLVTGGGGYLGCAVVVHLLRAFPGVRVTVFDNFTRGRVEGLAAAIATVPEAAVFIAPWEKADIRDAASVDAILAEHEPDTVVHLAAIVDAVNTNRPGRSEETRAVNHHAAVALARAAKRAGVGRFIYQSTVSMYSRGDNICEQGAVRPLSVYGQSKYDAELETLALSDDSFAVAALRSATLVGYTPCFAYQTIVNLSIVRALSCVSIRIFESAMEGPKTYLHVDDQASAIAFAIEHLSVMRGQAYNVTGFDACVREVIREIDRTTGRRPVYEVVPETAINQQVYTISSDKLRNLGWKPRHCLQDAVQDTVYALNAVHQTMAHMFGNPARRTVP